MTTDQKGTTQMTKTSNLSAFAYHTTLPDGIVRTIKAATRRYTHSVIVQYGDLPAGYNADVHPAAGTWAVYSDHSSEALAQKAAKQVAGRYLIHSGAVITGADGGQCRSFTDVRVVPMDNLRPEDMPEPEATTTLDPCPSCGSVRLESASLHDTTRYLVCQACGWHEPEDEPQAQVTQLPPKVAEAAKAVRATSEAENGPVADEDPDHLEDQAARLRERVDHIEQRYVEVRAEAMDAKAQVVALQDALERVTRDRDVLERALSDESADHSRQAQALMSEVADCRSEIASLQVERDGARASLAIARDALADHGIRYDETTGCWAVPADTE